MYDSARSIICESSVLNFAGKCCIAAVYYKLNSKWCLGLKDILDDLPLRFYKFTNFYTFEV